MPNDADYMRMALRLARRGQGATSPNPIVGAILVKGGKIIGRGWHHRAGEPHGEIEALRNALQLGKDPKQATLYVTLEPCCTHGRTPPCTAAIFSAGIRRVVVGATDPNPLHAGRAFALLKRAGIRVTPGILADECTRLNESFNHWIVHRTPLVTVKAAMTLDSKIATAMGESKWITGEKARECGMKLRHGADAILVGINTVLADDPGLTRRSIKNLKSQSHSVGLRRIILDARARTPSSAKVIRDSQAFLTTIVVGRRAPAQRVAALRKKVRVIVAPPEPANSNAQKSNRSNPTLDLSWLMRKLGAEGVTSLLVEGGGEVNASFLFGGLAHRIAFFYAPKILGGRDSRRAVAGAGAKALPESIRLSEVEWRRLGSDLLLTAQVLSR